MDEWGGVKGASPHILWSGVVLSTLTAVGGWVTAYLEGEQATNHLEIIRLMGEQLGRCGHG